MVIRRLQSLGVDWIYRFPRLGVVRFKKPEERTAPGDYSPSEAFAKETKEQEEEAAFAKMEAELERAFKASAEAASRQVPPPIGQAYQRVYGGLPSGWPWV